MSFLKKAFGAFVEFDEKPVTSGNTATTTQTKSVEKTMPTQTMGFDDTTIPDKFKTREISETTQQFRGVFNEEFYNHLQGEIEKNNIEGADYFEFRKTFEALKASMPEVAALTATYSALKANSPDLSVPKLLSTADVYLGVIDKEDTDFSNEYAAEYEAKVVGRELAIENEKETQAILNEEIEALKNKIEESKVRITELDSERNAEMNKLNSVKSNWDLTIGVVRQNIETDKKNISTYLEAKPTA